MSETTSDYMTATDAAEYLGVTTATLYSYVSRGMITSVVLDPGSRSKGYRRSDLVALRHRSTFRKDPDRAATEVIEFGTPILTTSISQVTETTHSYRGRSSSDLAAAYSFEQVTEFLWTGATSGQAGEFDLPAPSGAWSQEIDLELGKELPPGLTAVERLQSVLPVLERRDPLAYGVKGSVLVPSAVSLLLHLSYLSTGKPNHGSIAATLASAWSADPAKLDPLLVMVADHELNIATFTSRCIASAGATLYQAVLGGLAALQGYKHLYGQVSEAKSFYQQVMNTGDPGAVVRRYLRQRGAVPGFHNPYRRLYAGADPRVPTIVQLLTGSTGFPLLEETLKVAEAATGEHPRVDFALAVAEPLLGLPHDAIFSLIAIGRMAGMIAHIFEQYTSDRVIRPRARYVPGGVER